MAHETANETRWRHYAAAFLAEAKHRGISQQQIDQCLIYAKNLIRKDVPVIFDGNHVAALVGYSVSYVYGAARFQSTHYRYFSIQKKSGGIREIAEPLPSLKEIQWWILKNILEKIEISSAAKAYVSGRSIKDNARFHRAQKYCLTVDIKDFFPNIKSGRVYSSFRRIGYSKHVSALLTDLCCLDGHLPQGAPTSPALSNIIFRPIDEKHLAFSRKFKIRYTRYADDLTFSGDILPGDIISYIHKSLSAYGFELNSKKTRVFRPHQRQIVTGVVVNEKLQAPRSIRRQIRQDSYYIEKFGLEQHIMKRNIDRSSYVEHLLGRSGFVKFLNQKDRDANKIQDILKNINKDIGDDN